MTAITESEESAGIVTPGSTTNVMGELRVFGPFALGYFLSYLFRTINGPLADSLKEQFGLGERGLGLLTSAYFLAFAICQLPLGAALDRFGPRRVQTVLLGIAASGAVLFARADSATMLTVARALIGVGCSGALMAGLKSLVAAVPKQRLGLANGLYIMAGGLGATMSTLPIEALTNAIGWRGTFLVLAGATLATAGLIVFLAPEVRPAVSARRGLGLNGVATVFRSARFWHFAPASACVIGTIFAVHGLWAARWMTEIEHLSVQAVMSNMLAMGLGLTIGAATLGTVASMLRARGIPTTSVFLGACVAFAAVQALLVWQIALPAWLPGWLPWSVMAMFGGMTALSYSITAEAFAEDAIGRVNAALNVLHISMAFVLQAGMGMVVALWPPSADNHVPLQAFRAAFALPLALQVVAILWFVCNPAWRSQPETPMHLDLAGQGAHGPSGPDAEALDRGAALAGDS